jgi:hypothetical protein
MSDALAAMGTPHSHPVTTCPHCETHQHKQQTCEVPHPIFAHPNCKIVMAILEKVSLLALAIFAAYLEPKLFFPFFGGGIVLSIVLYIIKPKPEKECHSEEHHDSVACSQGFLEQLTGVRLPPPVGLAANVAITVCHIDHHSTVFVPLIGLNAGMWVGKLAIEYVPLICKEIKERYQACCQPQEIPAAV